MSSAHRSILTLVCIVGLCLSASHKTGAQKASTNRKAGALTPIAENPDIARVFELAFLVEPELGADTMISLVGARHIVGRSRQIDLLNEALRMSDRAKHPFRLEIVRIAGSPVDTAAGYAQYAYEKQLDRLSLRSRAIAQLAKVDLPAAKQILLEMNGRLDLKPAACEEMLVYNLDSIYRTVSEIAKSGFSEKEVREGDRAMFLSSWVSDVRSPAQLGPVLDLLAEFRVAETEREVLSSSFARAAVKNYADDRTLSHALVSRRIGSKLSPLAGGIEDGTKSPLVNAFRELLLVNLKGTRCRENALDEKGSLPQFVIDVNRLIPDKPIVLSEILQSSVGSAARVENAFQNEASARLNAELRRLRQLKPSSGDGKDAMAEWETKTQIFFEQLSSWEPAVNENGLLHFHEKSILFESLIQTVKDNTQLLSLVAARFLRFLDSSRIQQSDFPEWFTYVDRLPTLLSTDFEKISGTVPNNHFRLLALRRKLKI